MSDASTSVDAFLDTLKLYTKNAGPGSKSVFGSSKVSITFVTKRELAKQAKEPLTKALDMMYDQKQAVKREYNVDDSAVAKGSGITTEDAKRFLSDLADDSKNNSITATPEKLASFVSKLTNARDYVGVESPAPSVDGWKAKRAFKLGGRKSRKIGNKFNRCVKSVRQTVRARPKSTKESAAIAICTKSVLQTRGLTMKRYKKKRLVTQKKFRGGNWGSCS